MLVGSVSSRAHTRKIIIPVTSVHISKESILFKWYLSPFFLHDLLLCFSNFIRIGQQKANLNLMS